MFCDRFYRAWFDLDTPEATVGPILRIAVARCPRRFEFADGTTVQRGDRIGVLHFNNDRLAALHGSCPSPFAVGVGVWRQCVQSLDELAKLTEPEGRLSGVRAFVATTIFHRPLKRFGFEMPAGQPLWPKGVAIYQRAVLASFHPEGRWLRQPLYRHAERLWISGATLRAYRRPERPAVPEGA